jgi:hypothetical protein
LETTPDSTQYKAPYVRAYHGKYEQEYGFKDLKKDLYSATKGYYETLHYQEGIPRNETPKTWLLLILLMGYMALAFSRALYRKRTNMLFRTFLNWKLSKQIIRYEKVYTHPVNLLLTINFIICVPLFLSSLFYHYLSTNYSLPQLFIIIVIPLVFFVLFKLFFHQLGGWLFQETEAIEEYIFQTNLFNKYLGIVYLILSTLIIYSEIPVRWIGYTGFGILALFLLAQLIRGVLIGLQQNINLFLIILYLCTLEILPWLVLGKWIKNLF